MTTRVRSSGKLQRMGFAVIVRPILHFWVGVRIFGGDNIPDGPPYIIVANHASHLDAAIVLATLPPHRLPEIRPVAAADYFMRNRVLAWVTRTFFNVLPIPRSDYTSENDPIQLMKGALDEGSALLVFPEGTRITDDASEMQSFRSGVARLVEYHPDVPFVPMWVEGARRSMPKGTFFPVPVFCEVHIGAPRTVSGSLSEILEALERSVRELREST